MRHIVVFETESATWLVVDAESAGMVVSAHPSRHEAVLAANAEEIEWPARDLTTAA